jgi:hypothetical protein
MRAPRNSTTASKEKAPCIRFTQPYTPENAGSLGSKGLPAHSTASDVYYSCLQLTAEQKLAVERYYSTPEPLQHNHFFSDGDKEQTRARDLLAIHALDKGSLLLAGSQWSVQWSHRGRSGDSHERLLYQWCVILVSLAHYTY